MSRGAPLAVEDVTVRYGDGHGRSGAAVLDHVTLRFDAGALVAIGGPSGAGKSTLLKVIAGLLPPTEGLVEGGGIGGPRPRIGYVPQVETIDWTFPATVTECLSMTLRGRFRLRPRHDEADRIRAALARLGLADFADRHIRALSGGQQQRVFLARALLTDPDVLLLDEPTTAVDVRTRHDVMHELRRINDGGRGPTVILTTHDLDLAATHVGRMIFLDHRVVADGPPADVLRPEVIEAAFGAPLDPHLDHDRPFAPGRTGSGPRISRPAGLRGTRTGDATDEAWEHRHG